MDAMINRILGEQRKNPRLMNPLVLAYIGDTVYDLYVRSWLIEGSDATAHGLHVMATRKVCAKAQAAGAMAIMEQLTEDELYIFKRGRNSHMGTVPKHAEMSDYRAASGLEALLGVHASAHVLTGAHQQAHPASVHILEQLEFVAALFVV